MSNSPCLTVRELQLVLFMNFGCAPQCSMAWQAQPFEPSHCFPSNPRSCASIIEYGGPLRGETEVRVRVRVASELGVLL